MLYPLSYSRAARQCIKHADAASHGCERSVACRKAAKWHMFRACEGTLYRSGGSILSVVRRCQ
jgi:hypothetical protein